VRPAGDRDRGEASVVTSNTDWVRAIGRLELFAGLPQKSLKLIAQQMNEHQIPAGEVVLAEDTGGSFGRMYVVLEGTARAEVDGELVAEYGSGDHFGEMSLLDGEPRSATVIATTDLRLAGLASWHLRAILMEEPAVAVHLIEVLARRLRQANLRD
jgi:CRP-like cAMP-binding protein